MVDGPPGETIKLVILNILMLVAGFAALVKGADMFVEGSASLARRFHVPGLIIGLTIVAMGTSMPEHQHAGAGGEHRRGAAGLQ